MLLKSIGKRLFQMRKNMYLIRFKAEGMSDVGIEFGGEDGGNDQGYGEDDVFEEVEPDDDVVNGKKSGEKGKSKSWKRRQNYGNVSGQSGSKKVVADNMMVVDSEAGVGLSQGGASEVNLNVAASVLTGGTSNWQPHCVTPESSKRVANWASLFQSKEKSMQMEKSRIGHYSYMKLLREMEMAGSESEEDMENLSGDKFELVRFPDRWC
jgi:hypothetical protein